MERTPRIPRRGACAKYSRRRSDGADAGTHLRRCGAGPAGPTPPPQPITPFCWRLGTSTDDELARLRAGEATSMALLTCTSLGLSTSPVTEPLEIAEPRDALRLEVFGATDYPQMMLRVGWAPIGADPLPSTPRRPISEVISTLDGTPLC